ncbi:MAG TPA: endo alpha-1,4 polygalactosaminidase [Myxococcaceae bacterium]|nr:endo alpha-1,4 polygalactosaminidase [Myxococcaceae bacterium]
MPLLRSTLLFSALLWPSVGLSATARPSVAFFYGHSIPIAQLSHFDWVVVEPEEVKDTELSALQSKKVEVFAYISVGEAHRSRRWAKDLNPAWIIGFNSAWNSDIVDPAQAGWHQIVLKQMENFWRAGYRSFFLDTLDSYESVYKTDRDLDIRSQGMATLIRAMHERLPGVRLLLNRGFRFLSQVSSLAVGVVAESLFETWRPSEKRYLTAQPEDTEWLLEQLKTVSSRDHLPIIVIDYVQPGDLVKARATAQRIASLGFIPWVATSSLDSMGVGLLEVVSRRILVLYNGEEQPTPCSSAAHQMVVPLMEYLGFAVDYLDLRGELPDQNLIDSYLGLVTWFSSDTVPQAKKYRAWLLKQIAGGLRVAIFGRLGFEPDSAFLKQLGLRPAPGTPRPPFSVAASSELMGFEAKVSPPSEVSFPWNAGPSLRSHLTVQDSLKQELSAVVTGSWGGIAVEPFLLETMGEHKRWILNLPEFLRLSLKLPIIPAPDVTTENGSRILTIHIDGDGMGNRATMPGTPLAGRAILEKILQRFRLPTTVSVIEGEVSKEGVYPALAPELQEIAREIFALPHVEIASHTLSHPFEWDHLPQGKLVEEVNRSLPAGEKATLSIPGYRFDLDREISGSVDFINTRLAPAGKRVKVFLWSGTANPLPNALAKTVQAGLLNVNGGNTTITEETASLTAIAPMGCPMEGNYQVYTPVQNENVYTNLWTGPFYGYKQVIETFRLTDLPYRKKPISLYYHFYSGSKVASLKALETVYLWALSQNPFPMWLSEYAVKARDFNSVTFARRLDGALEVDGLDNIRTLRLDPTLGWPDLEKSEGVIGVRDIAQGRYVSVIGGRIRLALTDHPPAAPYLESANGSVLQWDRQGQKISFRIRGHVPIQAQFAATSGLCQVKAGSSMIKGVSKDGHQSFNFAAADTGPATLTCR